MMSSSSICKSTIIACQVLELQIGEAGEAGAVLAGLIMCRRQLASERCDSGDEDETEKDSMIVGRVRSSSRRRPPSDPCSVDARMLGYTDGDILRRCCC